MKHALESRLYFGRGRVTAAQWAAFLQNNITPRCADGYTLLSGVGRWQDAAGQVEEEEVAILVICHDSTPEWRDKLSALREMYCHAFAQSSVMLTQHVIVLDF